MTSSTASNATAIGLFIHGKWQSGTGHHLIKVINPATEDVVTTYVGAGPADIDAALSSAQQGLGVWRSSTPQERSSVLRRAALWLRMHSEAIAMGMTREMGKVLQQSRMEVEMGAETFEWYAEELRRVYGRVIPSRNAQVFQLVSSDPVGVVAGFSPWNFPLNQAVKKIAPALAAGCSIICKGPEEAPSAVVAICQALQEAGLPPGVLNLLFGIPADISSRLLASPIVRKLSFTGSVPVGLSLAGLAAKDLKRTTFELGGHAPVIITNDIDITAVAAVLVDTKIRNAGQTCISPTRFLVQQRVFADLRDAMVETFERVTIGDSASAQVQMGPVANQRRLQAMQDMTSDARDAGARIACGGERHGSRGYFWKPTLIERPPLSLRAMLDEPFGPLGLMIPYTEDHEAITEANRLPFGLAAYVFCRSSTRARRLAQAVESGMLSINHFGLGLPETPFGGVKHSGLGLEGGLEGIHSYLTSRFTSEYLSE